MCVCVCGLINSSCIAKFEIFKLYCSCEMEEEAVDTQIGTSVSRTST